MKSKFLIFGLLILQTAFAQTRKSTEIIINSKVDKETFIKMLIESDNFVESEKYGVITTELRNSKTKPNWSHQYHYRIIFKENTVEIKPYWTMAIRIDLGVAEADSQLEKWKWSKGKNINGFIHTETLEMLNKAGYTNISYN